MSDTVSRAAPPEPDAFTAATAIVRSPDAVCAGDGILDRLIDDAPALVRKRTLLPAVDWREATPAQVARLVSRLEAASVRLPAWLAKALLVAGHAIDPERAAHLAPELRLLARIVSCPGDDGAADAIGREIATLADATDLDTDVAGAIVTGAARLGLAAAACRLALAGWPRQPAVLRPVRAALDAWLANRPELRIHVAGTSTTHGLAAALPTAFATKARRASVTEAPFGDVIAALLAPEPATDATVVLLDQDGALPVDWRASPEQAEAMIGQRIGLLADALRTFASRSSTPVLINTLPSVALPAAGFMDHAHPSGAARIAARLNSRLAEVAAASPGVVLVDADQALAAIAPDRRSDPKLFFVGRIAYSDEAMRALALAFARAWSAEAVGPAKVLALDFDNTLWGGVFGDDGVDRLHCGDDAPGNAFKALQHECLRLKQQGMLLVALSKNNPDAIEVFARNPGMTLAADDFAATAIDWEPKPGNIRRIAKELNLGLDSFVFIDDSPHEREAMRRLCPEVHVPEMPADPAQRPSWLRGLSATWPARLTSEDRQRSDYYVAERKARELRETVATYDDYLRGLGQRLHMAKLGPSTLARIAQLHQRTNQFNLTTLRLGEAELSARAADPDRGAVLLGRVTDTFGDHGIVITSAVSMCGEAARLDTLLMSCRVMSRQIETAFLGALIGWLTARGIRRIEASYRPTPKNAMVRNLYASHGFEPVAAGGDETRWSWSTTAPPPQSPFVEVIWEEAQA